VSSEQWAVRGREESCIEMGKSYGENGEWRMGSGGKWEVQVGGVKYHNRLHRK
jgi:hypothetical protein